MKSSLAQFIGCQSPYLSRVLSKQAHFSFEQAEATSHFFKLSSLEKKYFLTLFQYNRCQSRSGKDYLLSEVESLRKQALNIKKRVEVESGLSSEDQEIYYSSWIYAALHVLSSLQHIKTTADLARCLNLSIEKIEEPMTFLLEKQLVVFHKKKGLDMGTKRIHIGDDSHLVSHHHRNWRIQALQAIAELDKKSLHYSSVVTLSDKDSIKVKNRIIEFIKDIKEIIRDSEPTHTGYSFNLDFFRIDRS